jgi:pimeloyl-ACP methyl ester carboxylesterase
MSPRSGRDFDEFAVHLADRRLVVCPDVPGYGGSDPPPAPPSIEDYAAAILEGLDRLAPRGRSAVFDLVGQHTGAAIAVEMALQAPRRVRRLVLVGVPMFDDRERDELRRAFARPRPYFEDPEFVGTTWKRDVAAIRDGLSQEAMLMRFTEILRAGPRSWWGFNAVFDYPMRERVSRVRQPLLTVALDERLGAATRAAATLAGNGRCVEIPELSGAALDFAAGRLAATAREFLDAEETAARPG